MSEQTLTIAAQAGQLGDFFRDTITKAVEDGGITPELLKAAQDNPDVLGQRVMKAILAVANMGSFVDSQLLEPVSLVILGGCESFDPSSFFKGDKDEQPDKIPFWLGDSDFTDNFLGKVETDVAPATIRIYKLKEDANDARIIPEIGEEVAETTLFHFYEMLKKQPSGEDGDLLTDGKDNIFYIKDKVGELWAVRCRWESDEWNVYADSVTDPYEWRAGDQILSR
jgi:hypothetical protein